MNLRDFKIAITSILATLVVILIGNDVIDKLQVNKSERQFTCMAYTTDKEYGLPLLNSEIRMECKYGR
ncbi:MAG: hypothetical protein DRQ35_01410 [Gammaproteobacteria bacterium]|nr:MAG: hypothetical protein DRQ35_01410 [Gammaproteobacteria bacterium]